MHAETEVVFSRHVEMQPMCEEGSTLHLYFGSEERHKER